jgi:hypothetical protein
MTYTVIYLPLLCSILVLSIWHRRLEQTLNAVTSLHLIGDWIRESRDYLLYELGNGMVRRKDLATVHIQLKLARKPTLYILLSFRDTYSVLE